MLELDREPIPGRTLTSIGDLIRTTRDPTCGTMRRRFLRADLAAVNRSHTPWLVVGGHRPFYIDSTNAEPGWGDLTVADDLQNALEDLFVQHQVRSNAQLSSSARLGAGWLEAGLVQAPSHVYDGPNC